MAMQSRASICSLMRMMPSSAHMAEPARPATMMAVRVGPSSMMRLSATTVPNMPSAPKRLRAL